MATTTNVSNLKINVLTKEQYDAATKDENQLYLITNNTTEFLALTGGTLTGELILAADPTENLGAATKQYVDNSINTGTITAVQANGTDVATSGTANIPAASTSAYGVTKLSSATNSTSTDLAATPSAVKSAYDTAAAAMPKSGGTFTGATYAQANTSYTAYQLRNIALSTSAATPTDNGSILGVYS